MADTTGRIPFVASALQFIRDLGLVPSPSVSTSGKFIGLYAPAVYAGDNYQLANDKQIREATTLDTLFSDDFGGTVLDTVIRWDYFNGGLPINPIIDGKQLTQAAIGSGITTGNSYNVAASVLNIVCGLTAGSEQLFLSQQTFAAKEDILLLLSKNHNYANFSCFIGMVEVDPVTLIPLINPNIAADGNGASEFTNRGGCEFGKAADLVSIQTEAIGDSSGAVAVGNVGTSASMATPQEFFIEIDNHDIQASSCAPDTIGGKLSTASRVSTQCPNDNKLYKLAIRVRAIGALANATTVSIPRILVSAHVENRVQITGGEGDQQAQKAIAAYIVNSLTATISGTISENITQFGGTAVDVNSGNKSAGTLRVVLATDQPQLTAAWLAAQSGAWSVGLNAGANIIGKVGIDQTTDGTTNRVNATMADGNNATLGAKADASSTDHTATLSLISIAKGILQALKSLVVLGAGTNLIGKVGIDQTTPGTTNAVAQNGTWTVGLTQATGANAQDIQGPYADNAAGSVGNPMPIGAIARSTNRTAATTARTAVVTSDLAGNLVVQPVGIPQAHLFSGKVALSNTTETSLIAAGGATVRNKLTTICFANRDTVAHTFDIRDATAGTIQFSVIVPASDSKILTFGAPACAAALNTAWTVQLRETVTTTNPEVSAQGYSSTA